VIRPIAYATRLLTLARDAGQPEAAECRMPATTASRCGGVRPCRRSLCAAAGSCCAVLVSLIPVLLSARESTE